MASKIEEEAQEICGDVLDGKVVTNNFNSKPALSLSQSVVCSCGASMKAVQVSQVYGYMVNTKCESCKVTIISNEMCFHCPKSRDPKRHRIAFDYCTRCVEEGYSVDNPPPYKSDALMFLSDRDFSIIIAYWYRTLIADMGGNRMVNVPLTVIEHHIIPYIYAKKAFQYNVTVGLFELEREKKTYDTKCQQFMTSLVHDINDELRRERGDRQGLGHQWSPRGLPRSKGAAKVGGGLLVSYKDCEIGKYAVEIDFHSIPVNKSGTMTVRSVSTILDVSVAVVLCGDSEYDTKMVKKVASKILRHSDDIYVVYLHFGTNVERIDKLEKELKAELEHKVEGFGERLKRYNKTRESGIQRIRFKSSKKSDSVDSLMTMLNRTITAYIQRLDTLYRAV